MEWGTIAGTISAFAGLLTAIGGLLLSFKVLMPTHKIVNQQRTDMLRFQKVLTNFIEANNLPVPEDQSKIV